MGLKSLFRRHDGDHDEAGSSNDPPAYSDMDKKSGNAPPEDQDAPSYEQPTFPGASTIVPATIKFPPRLNVYYTWKSARTFHLGPSADNKLFAVTTSWAVYGMKKPLLTIYDGPDKNAPVLAETSPLSYTVSQRSTITLPAVGDAAPVVVHLAYEYSLTTIVNSFTLVVPPPPSRKGDAPQEESFEWRSTMGDEVKQLTGGGIFSSGWKLVRKWGPETRPAADGPSGPGFASDGREIVAVMAHNNSMSMTKSSLFAFMGTGLTGQLGAQWEVVAIASALQMWWAWTIGTTYPR
ncbi:hypothetical protein ACHAQA_007156 [Verticillium albo-atrum]